MIVIYLEKFTTKHYDDLNMTKQILNFFVWKKIIHQYFSLHKVGYIKFLKSREFYDIR